MREPCICTRARIFANCVLQAGKHMKQRGNNESTARELILYKPVRSKDLLSCCMAHGSLLVYNSRYQRLRHECRRAKGDTSIARSSSGLIDELKKDIPREAESGTIMSVRISWVVNKTLPEFVLLRCSGMFQ